MKEIDAIHRSYDLTELAVLGRPRRRPADAGRHNVPDLSRQSMKQRRWLYDDQHGWTAAEEQARPRPKLQSPPYFTETFKVQTRTRADSKHDYVVVNLRGFPKQARVFVDVPTEILPQAAVSNLLAAKPRSGLIFPGVHRPTDVRHYNLIAGARYREPTNRSRTVLELQSGTKALLNNLHLPSDSSIELRFSYAVLSKTLRSKTHYEINIQQFTNYRLSGRFTHIFQAYHPYDVPLIGDRRTRLVYRRSAREVAQIPPMAIAHFDTYVQARAMGFDPDPRSFGRHFEPGNITASLREEVLEFFNDRRLSAAKLTKLIEDNPNVNAAGVFLRQPEKGRGMDSKTAARVIAKRKKLGRKGFTNLEQIHRVSGIGADTMSDIISTVLQRRRSGRGRWNPDQRIIEILTMPAGKPGRAQSRRRPRGKK